MSCVNTQTVATANELARQSPIWKTLNLWDILHVHIFRLQGPEQHKTAMTGIMKVLEYYPVLFPFHNFSQIISQVS